MSFELKEPLVWRWLPGLATIGTVAMLLAGCETQSPPVDQLMDAPPRRDLPINFAQGHLYVPVHLFSEPQDRQFFLDSGAAGTLISDSIARRLFPDLRRWKRVTLRGVNGTVNGFMVGRLALGLGGRPAVFPSALTIWNWPRAMPFPRGTDGALGYDLFNRFVVRIDYRALSLRLIAPADFEYAGSGVILPLRVGRDHMPKIELGLNFKDGTHLAGEFTVDTGSDEGVFVTRGQGALPTEAANGPDIRTRRTSTFGGMVGERDMPLASVNLGPTVWPFAEVSVATQPDRPAARARLSGAVGNKLLGQFKTVIFDYERNRLILEKEEGQVVAQRR
jgi:hypothetical protein